MFDVFRFAWFAVRTFLGLIGVVLTLYGALWLFVKLDSTLQRGSRRRVAAREVVQLGAHGRAVKRIGLSARAVVHSIATLRMSPLPCARPTAELRRFPSEFTPKFLALMAG